MAETITIPSPSLFLNSPTHVGSKTTASKPPTQTPKDGPKASESSGITKRKQSKSRNGCSTCKAKRLKCDETKPTCKQCERRQVACGGYKKDFKWRSFEEASFTGKPPPAKGKRASPPPTFAPLPPKPTSPTGSNDSHGTIRNPHTLYNAYYPAPHPPGPFLHSMPINTPFQQPQFHADPNMLSIPQTSPHMMAPSGIPYVEQFEPSSVESSNSVFDQESVDTRPTKTTAPSSISSGQSPRLVDLLLPGTDLNAQPEEYMSFRAQYPESFYQPSFSPLGDPLQEDDVEEIPRTLHRDHEAWVMRLPSPSPSNSSASSSDSYNFPLLRQLEFSMTSPEMLTRRFDRDTCGILSVKDGPTENPWRTLVWPLARDCPALYHAIASMTSFHQSRDSPTLRIQGIDHMRTSVHSLAASLENMRVDAAISTTLVLAFSESWDQHISTGINHIKGAKLLIDRALEGHNRTPLRGEELRRLKFLGNVWIYMDVIARLTSADDDESNYFDNVSDMVYSAGEVDGHMDPLMGCAHTLFPIIGRVANLVRKVRKHRSNSPTIISQAVHLKSQLEEWIPPAFIEDPEDETTSPHDSIKTATAYQYATLLYLHQAVPEIPSLPSLELAKKALCELATVEPRSRAIIVQIYPLMAAGCEVVEEEDREWVENRWSMMAARMKIGVIEKCQEVTKEVWNRRDVYHAEKVMSSRSRNSSTSSNKPPSCKRDFSSISDHDTDESFWWLDNASKRRAMSLDDIPMPTSFRSERSEGKRRAENGTEPLPREKTVRGRLHWLGVMKDWNWEILLG